jgi:putative ABC transport system permease protein
MGRITLRSVWRHKRRLVSTVLAIVLGVGFMSGTLILSTTLDQAADDLLGQVLDDVDVVVQGERPASSSLGERPSVPESLVGDVEAIDGVAAAAPYLSLTGTHATNRILAPTGYPLGTELGPATTFENWIDDPAVSTYRLVDGRAPAAADEVVLNADAASAAQAGVGSIVNVLGQFGPEPHTLVGTFTVGSAGSSGGAIAAGFTLAEMQRLAGRTGSVDSVRVAAGRGTSADTLVARLADEWPDLDVLTGHDASAQAATGASGDLGFLRLILVVFGVVALFVGTFVIANTFRILVAQRTKELALLRALGASRSQVFGSVLAEAAIVGTVASVVGLGLGIYLAAVINRGLDQIGAQVPSDALVLRAGTVGLAFVMGVAATLGAAVMPAWRATRVLPLAALRDVEVDRSAASLQRVAGGVGTLVVGIACCVVALRSAGDPRAIPTVGLGAVLVMVGLIACGPLVAGRIVGRARRLLTRLHGVTGRLASDNAARNPSRTSATGAAVVISVALVVFVMAFAASALRSIESDARRGFAGDFIVTGPGGLTLPNGLLSSPIPATVAESIRAIDGVRLVAAIGFDPGELTFPDGATTEESVTSVDVAGLGPILRPAMDEGEAGSLDDDGILLDRVLAERHHVGIGDRVRYRASPDRSVVLRVEGISDDPNVLGYATVSRRTYASVADTPRDVQVGGLLERGADPEVVLGQVRLALTGIPTLSVFTRDQFVGDLKTQVSGFINVIYGLLLLSVVISVIGISNTLSLTIHERTRELGLLRSIGMDRTSVRSMIRWEAVLIALLGMSVGVVVGAALSVAVVLSLRDYGLVTVAVPASGLAAIAAGSVVVGALAAIRPAGRAAAVSILDAIGGD